MKEPIDFSDVSDIYESLDHESPCDGNCGCLVPCPNCKGHHHENENKSDSLVNEMLLTNLSIS